MTDPLTGPVDTTVDDDPISFLEPVDNGSDPNAEDGDENALGLAMFEGDTSALYPEQRRCLHALLKLRYVSAERHPEHWVVLLADESLIRSRLNELFLELHVDRGYQVAFKRQASTESSDSLPSLLREVSHTKEETIVMVFLRQRFFAQRQEGEDVVFIDRQTLLDAIADQRPEHATHRAMDHKRALKAIDGLATAGVLLKTADPDRMRISPIIEVLLPIEKLRSLWAWLMTQNGAEDSVPADTSVTLDEELDLLLDTEEER